MPEKRILLVEDEAEICEIVAVVLRGEGYHVDAAGTVAEAVNLLGRSVYGLVIADWRLPDGNGLLVANLGAQMGAKTILMTGFLFQIPVDRTDGHDTLMKPLRPREIVDAVERSIGKAGLC